MRPVATGRYTVHVPRSISGLDAEMAAVQLVQLLHRQEPQPDEERQLRLTRELGKPGRGLDERLLQDIPCINSSLQSCIHTQFEHPRYSIAFKHQQIA